MTYDVQITTDSTGERLIAADGRTVRHTTSERDALREYGRLISRGRGGVHLSRSDGAEWEPLAGWVRYDPSTGLHSPA